MTDSVMLPAAESAQFLAWEAIAGARRDELLSSIEEWMEADFAAGVTRVLAAPLPFYRSAELVAFSFGDDQPDKFCVIARAPDFRLVWLDATNEPIYGLNEAIGLTLDPSLIMIYARFFFHFVRAQGGAFQIMERETDLPWLDSADAAQRAQAAALLMPLTYLGLDRDGFHHLCGTVLFKNALFKTDILCAGREADRLDPELGVEEHFGLGQMKLTDEDLLLEDLPVMLRPPGNGQS